MNIKKILILIVLLGLFLNNAVEAMERTTEQKIDSDLIREVYNATDELRLQEYFERLSMQQRAEVIERITNFAATLLDRVDDNELNVPPHPREGYESIIIFMLGSALSFILIRYGADIWNFMRELTGSIVRETIQNLPNLPPPTVDQMMNMARFLISRDPIRTREFFEEIMRNNVNPA